MAPLLDAYDKDLNREQDRLGARSNRLADQLLPTDATNMSPAQAMAIARRIQANGGVQAMETVANDQTDPHAEAHLRLLVQRLRQAEDAIARADAWVKAARAKAQQKYDSAYKNCPTRQLGELTEKTPSCVRAAIMAHQNTVHRLATDYLGRVANSLTAFHTMTKVVVDEQMETAKKLEYGGGGLMRQSQAAALESRAIGYILKYNGVLDSAVGTAYDLASFKAGI